MIVLGAGMAGLLAANVLRNKCTAVYEAQPSLPNNHSAILRFRSSIVGDTLNIPFKKVKMIKSIEPWRNAIADAMAYSKKTNNGYHMRSVFTADGSVNERYISPPDLIQQMFDAVMAPVNFGYKLTRDSFAGMLAVQHPEPIISTLPMPVLMDLLNYPGERPKFQSQNGQTITATVEVCDAYCSLYIPDPIKKFYRVSLTGSILIIEYANEEQLDVDSELAIASDALGIENNITEPELRTQMYAKILPISENARRKFIIWSSDHHNVHSLGRFATWRPGLLLDDLINDIRVIQQIASSNNYDSRKATTRP